VHAQPRQALGPGARRLEIGGRGGAHGSQIGLARRLRVETRAQRGAEARHQLEQRRLPIAVAHLRDGVAVRRLLHAHIDAHLEPGVAAIDDHVGADDHQIDFEVTLHSQKRLARKLGHIVELQLGFDARHLVGADGAQPIALAELGSQHLAERRRHPATVGARRAIDEAEHRHRSP
jgi:hypothetical protein